MTILRHRVQLPWGCASVATPAFQEEVTTSCFLGPRNFKETTINRQFHYWTLPSISPAWQYALHYKTQSWVYNVRMWRKQRRLRCPPLTAILPTFVDSKSIRLESSYFSFPLCVDHVTQHTNQQTNLSPQTHSPPTHDMNNRILSPPGMYILNRTLSEKNGCEEKKGGIGLGLDGTPSLHMRPTCTWQHNADVVTTMGEMMGPCFGPPRALPLSTSPNGAVLHGPIISPMVVTTSALCCQVHVGRICSEGVPSNPNPIPFFLSKTLTLSL